MRIPSIKELRALTQGHITFPWPDRLVSIYFTWALLHTPITANQATLLDLLFGVVGCAFLFAGGDAHALVGGMFLLLFVIFDDVDGEIARYRQSCSKASYYLEGLCHPIMHPLKFSSLGYGLAVGFGEPWLFFVGMYVMVVCYVEQSSSWRREIMLKGDYSYARIYNDVRKAWPASLKFLFTAAAYVMQEMGMYVMIFLAAAFDFLFPGAAATLFFGYNAKTGLLLFYALAMTPMTLLNIKKSVDLVREHFGEGKGRQ